MDSDGLSPSAGPAGEMRNKPSEPQRPDGEADAHSQTAASPVDSAAALTTDGGSLSLARSVIVASDSPQQAEQSPSAPVPLSVIAADAHPPSAAGRLAEAAADSATSVSAATANSAAATVPMFRCINECRDVQFALMQLLALKELAALDSTCRSWRRWLLHPPHIDGLHFSRSGTFLQLLAPAMSDWARQMVTTMELQLEGGIRVSAQRLLPGSATVAAESAACDQLLSALPRFTRLHTLSLQLCDAFAITRHWPPTFAALAGSLRELRLHGHGNRQAALINAALAHVGWLRRLITLTVFVGNHRIAREVDLARLPSLPRLRKFGLSVVHKSLWGDSVWFRCAPQQVRHLAQCSRLVYLDCGIWSPDERESDSKGRPLPPAAQQIDEGIAALVRGLTLQPAAAAAAGASESASSIALPTDTPAPCRLQYLNLRGTVMSAAVWEHVSRLTELRELWPQRWRSDMTPQLWSRLADLTRLKRIYTASHPDDDFSTAPLRTEHFLPHLLRCKQLETVRLLGPALVLSLSAAQLDGIARLPLLRVLGLHCVEVESIAPLVQAAGLKRLYLLYCSGPPAVVDFRSSLPPLPALTRLQLWDCDRITEVQSAPLNAALFARMPKLTPAKFEENLLAL